MVAVVSLVIGDSASADTQEMPEGLRDAMDRVLDDWVQFAATGGLEAVGVSFVAGGPQLRQFEIESNTREIVSSQPPLRLEARKMRLRRYDPSRATVWVEVEASRVGYISEVFGWDFDLVRDDGRWLVWTVVPATEPTEPPEMLVSGSPTTLSTTTTTTASGAYPLDRRDTDHRSPVAAASSSSGTRIPVLSAWIVVVTVVGVAVAGYLAPRFDRGGEG